MKRLKVMTVVGTRPEVIRLSRVISKLDIYTNHVLVHTGQNYDYELNEIFFSDLGIRKPDYVLDSSGSNSAEIIGKVIINVDKVLEEVDPDALLVLGDTNSCMSVIPAKRRKIPIFHMEAGNRCFDQRVPEEINRRIVDHTADINLTYSSIAREYLLGEGLPPDMVIKTGSPMKEVLSYYSKNIEDSMIVDKLGLTENQFFLVSVHREENIDSTENFSKVVTALNCIAQTYKLPVVLSTHPRTRKRIQALGVEFDPEVRLLKPLSFTDYNKLQISAKAVISDSGTISEESSILNFPALNIREAHERPEAMEETSVILGGLELDRIFQAIDVLQDQPRGGERLLHQVADYEVSNVSDKVLRIIISYVDYVNRVVWKKF
ncbi:UDP-N-acetylglucosamine 2-epimerase (non-hydrolyzing) [Gammaproteobacteria bacterium]|nr:UDP-N-acetylglucosamine 2-epimerase (non-hydrolyzing) [Gammaproteobacteria bacterium]